MRAPHQNIAHTERVIYESNINCDCSGARSSGIGDGICQSDQQQQSINGQCIEHSVDVYDDALNTRDEHDWCQHGDANSYSDLYAKRVGSCGEREFEC
jgi:hypothetical protein